ncbi:Protein of unknown function, partial [Gryllus bimaculatus]
MESDGLEQDLIVSKEIYLRGSGFVRMSGLRPLWTMTESPQLDY